MSCSCSVVGMGAIFVSPFFPRDISDGQDGQIEACPFVVVATAVFRFLDLCVETQSVSLSALLLS